MSANFSVGAELTLCCFAAILPVFTGHLFGMSHGLGRLCRAPCLLSALHALWSTNPCSYLPSGFRTLGQLCRPRLRQRRDSQHNGSYYWTPASRGRNTIHNALAAYFISKARFGTPATTFRPPRHCHRFPSRGSVLKRPAGRGPAQSPPVNRSFVKARPGSENDPPSGPFI